MLLEDADLEEDFCALLLPRKAFLWPEGAGCCCGFVPSRHGLMRFFAPKPKRCFCRRNDLVLGPLIALNSASLA